MPLIRHVSGTFSVAGNCQSTRSAPVIAYDVMFRVGRIGSVKSGCQSATVAGIVEPLFERYADSALWSAYDPAAVATPPAQGATSPLHYEVPATVNTLCGISDVLSVEEDGPSRLTHR